MPQFSSAALGTRVVVAGGAALEASAPVAGGSARKAHAPVPRLRGAAHAAQAPVAGIALLNFVTGDRGACGLDV